jgi:hypothetical protein
MTTPLELPIRRMLTRRVRMVITMLFRCAWRVQQAAKVRNVFRPGSQPNHAVCSLSLFLPP